MSIYYIRDITTKRILQVSRRADGDIPDLDAYSNWEKCHEVWIDAPTEYDTATQRIEQTHVETPGNPIEIVNDWQIIALTQQQLDALADEANRDAKKPGITDRIAFFRTWANEAAAVTITNGNNNAETQTAIRRIGHLCTTIADMIEYLRIDK